MGCVGPQLSMKLSAFRYLRCRRYFSLVCVMLAREVTGRTPTRLILDINKELDFFIEKNIENKVTQCSRL